MDRATVEAILRRPRIDCPDEQHWTFLRGPWVTYGADSSNSVLSVQYSNQQIVTEGGPWLFPPLAQFRKEIPEQLYLPMQAVHLSPVADLGVEYPSPRFSPTALIQAVNTLHALGQREAGRVIRSYAKIAARIHDETVLQENRLFFIIRLLFMPRAEGECMPVMRMGLGNVTCPEEDPRWSLFPLVLVDDVPFLLVTGYTVGGARGSPLAHLDYCIKHCTWRTRPLAPTSSPIAAVEKLLISRQWRELFEMFENNGQQRDMAASVRGQALRTLTSQSGLGIIDTAILYRNDQWKKYVSPIENRRPRWNALVQGFIADE
jgi:hypothetical protein